jgi:hypothetical protein
MISDIEQAWRQKNIRMAESSKFKLQRMPKLSAHLNNAKE